MYSTNHGPQLQGCVVARKSRCRSFIDGVPFASILQVSFFWHLGY